MADKFFSSVSLLFHGEGADGSQAIVDSSSFAETISVAASFPAISTVNFKFGAGSLLGGVINTNARVELKAHPANFQFPGDFTIECWAYFASTDTMTTQRVILGDGATWSAALTNATPTQMSLAGNLGAFPPFDNAWHHLAWVRYNGVITGYVDGVAGTTPVSDAGTKGNGTTAYTLGDGSGNDWGQGYIDELRITKGVARYTRNFAVPTEAFPNIGEIIASASSMSAVPVWMKRYNTRRK